MEHAEKPDKMERQLYEPFPNQRLDEDQQKRIRDAELAQFATAFGVAPPD